MRGEHVLYKGIGIIDAKVQKKDFCVIKKELNGQINLLTAPVAGVVLQDRVGNMAVRKELNRAVVIG